MDLPKRVARTQRPPRVLYRWRYVSPQGEATDVLAATRSEARARLKRALGLARLPVGACVSREG